ncbi:MAG: ATP-binding protein [Candidatus Eisenbacteria bacterium]|uniref:ATP-binding protein n=1 Tax=Eiseniibacteriota bacterium TaxID=2212470 RepID=A0A538SWG0_UNCEI|nr:MAG: ATP-binding protein [Candidatus Eisenbacteria bacterium]
MGAAQPTPSQDESGTVTLTIGSRLELLSLVHGLIGELAGQFELDDELVNAVTIAVIEAGTNAIQHGNVFADDKTVTFVFRVSPGDIAVRVDDHGRGFDASKVEDPTDPSNLLDPHGRGLYLMRALMDEVTFETRGDHGTTVHLRKSRGVAAR